MAKPEVAAIEARCAKIAADMGYELVDAAIEKEPTGKYLRFYIDRPEDTGKAIQAFSSFVDPRPRNSSGRTGLVDWETDFELIAAAVNHVLGTECRSLPYLHWRSFLGAYMEISSESLFSRVISIRDKLRTGKKMEKWEKAWYRKNRDLVDLPMKFSKKEIELLEEWT